jgi:enoyl-CoA hydratase
MSTPTPAPNVPPPEGTITTERRGALLLIGINRPAKRNGFTPRMYRELAEAYTLLDDDADAARGRAARRSATISLPGWTCPPSHR